MNMTRFRHSVLFPSFIVASLLLLGGMSASASGPVGEHVNDLQAHLDDYTEEVDWLIDQVDGIVDAYERGGLEAATPEALVDHWEAVKFHSAIETNYVPLYARIWQGLFGVRQAIEKEESMDAVRAQQKMLEQTLWQSLGAVKVAAQFQQRGMLPAIAGTEAGSPMETIDIIKRELERVVAKYAEKLPDEANTIVQDTYIQRFEGIEGTLIEQDAALVEDLELDFNVILPKALQDGATVDEVNTVVTEMHGKLDRARALLEDAEQSRSDVF